jgi:hypothetical protein
MAITVCQVRNALNKTLNEILTDDTIDQSILVATNLFEFHKLTDARQTDVDNACIYLAAYLSVLAYGETMHRQYGDFPITADIELTHLWRLVEIFGSIVLGDLSLLRPLMKVASQTATDIGPVAGVGKSVLSD